MKRILFIILVLVLVFAITSTAFAYWEVNRKDYTITNIAASGGVLWSASTIKKTDDYHENTGACNVDYIKRVASPTVSGNLTARLYETNKSTQAMPNPLHLYDGEGEIDIMYDRYIDQYDDGINKSFYMKFYNGTNYALKAFGQYCIGFDS